jgi:hypothetical protein
MSFATRHMNRHWKCGLGVALVVAVGCTTSRTTALKRIAGDTYAASSNGDIKRTGAPRPFRGVPVVLDVVTHFEVTITETAYLYRTGTEAGKCATMQEMAFSGCSEAPRILDAKIEPVKRKKLFSLDIARPAAGTLRHGMTFVSGTTGSTGGYLAGVNAYVEERTIKDVTALLENTGIKKLLGVKGAANQRTLAARTDNETGATLKNKTHKIERTVAYALFDADAPDLETTITAFLDHHIGACHSCDGWAGEPCDCPAAALPRQTDQPLVSVIERSQPDSGKPSPADSTVIAATQATRSGGGRRLLREKETPYMVTAEFTLYEVEVVDNDDTATEAREASLPS